MSPALALRAITTLRLAWRLLREWSGDLAYERYVSHSGDGPHLGRQAFYLESLRRRYRRPNRCC